MGRIRIASRLILIVVGAIVLIQILTAMIYFADRRSASPDARYSPLIGQIVALTQTLDRVPAADRDLVLRAATGIRFTPRIRADIPANAVHTPILRAAERRLRFLLGAPVDRFIALTLMVNDLRGGQPMHSLRDAIHSHLRAVIGLTSGGYLEIESSGDLTARLYGIPIGFFAGVFGLIIALAALIAVRRETKPISDLAMAVERFGTQVEAHPVVERGAPDLRALARTINTMQARISALLRSRTLVLGAISHDLRTYVTRLQLRLELLPASETRAKAIADLNAMQSLMDDALAFAQASFVKGPVETVDLTRIVRAECEAHTAQGAAVTLSAPETSAPLMVRATPAALSRVIANLIDNAVAYGGSAEVSLKANGHQAELLIDDRGPGIPPAERERVFEPFYRLEPSRNRNSGGAGLGLTIVRQIVEAQGGTIAIEDRPGGGARIRVGLPRAAAGQ
jgi:signal transduction histidine kinase